MEENDSGRSPRESEASKVKEARKQKLWSRNSAPIPLRPIRLIQLILDIMLISVTVSLWTSLKNPMGTGASICLIILFAIFAIIMSIDAVGQIRGFLTPDLPMFLVSLLGFILFTLAAQLAYLLVYRTAINGSVLVLIALCLVAALFFLLDAMIMTMYWRYTYSKRGKCIPCLPDKSVTILYQQPAHDTTSKTLETRFSDSEPIVRDVATSVSQEEQRFSKSEIFVFPDDNGIGVGERRQYVDRPTSPDSKTLLKLTETQTEPVEPAEFVDQETSAVSHVEERDVQTSSQCPVCFGTVDSSPEGICPSFLSLVQSFGMFSCAGSTLPVKSEAPVLVDRGTLPGSISSLSGKESIIMITKKPPRVYETRPCPTHGAGLLAKRAGLPNPVTRICLPHCIRKNKKTQTPRSKPIVITDKYQNTEESRVEETTTTKNSSETDETSTTEVEVKSPEYQKSFEEVEKDTRENSEAENIEQNLSEIKKESLSEDDDNTEREKSSGGITLPIDEAREESSSEVLKIEKTISTPFQDSLSLPPSSDEENPKSQGNSILENSTGSKKGSLVGEESSASRKALPKNTITNEKNTSQKNFFQRKNKVDSITSTGTSPMRRESSTISTPLHSDTRSQGMSRYSNESRESVSPTPSCQCSHSHYYYRDVFGRYICSHCAHKYLIKIPQRCTVKPIGDVRCCSCSREIMHQPPNSGQSRSGKCWKCRYQMYAGNKK